jgi:phage/plasmid-like protein (TIGR03299 family)
MAHEIDMTNGRANIAFLGSRKDVWHRLGQEMQPGQSLETWAQMAGLGWQAVKVPSYASLPDGRMVAVDDQSHIMRDDTWGHLGTATDGYQLVQPQAVLEWFQEYIAQDERFALDVAGALRGGRTIWATATFNGPLNAGGDEHRARLLMSTTFDGSGATINQATMTRTVCANTLAVATSDKRAVIRTTHRSKFNKDKVRKELADIAASFDTYRAMADAMRDCTMERDQMSAFFKSLLDIPLDAKRDDISPRKLGAFEDLGTAYIETVKEGTPAFSAWAALNSVTRYADHGRAVRNAAANGGEEAARFYNANFNGTGATMKANAVAFLMPLIRDRVAVAA